MLTFIDGDKLLFKALEDSFAEGMMKSLPSPGKNSFNAYLLAHNDKKFFIKPTTEEICKKELIVQTLAKHMGLEHFFLPVCMIKIKDGVYGTVNPMLSDSFCSLQDFEKNIEHSMNGILETLHKSGNAHKLAVLDYFIDNYDRHRGNVFSDGKSIILIDHDRAFKKTEDGFIPGYLRNTNYSNSKELPTCDDESALRKWLIDLKISQIDVFNKIKELSNAPGRLDVAINKIWEKQCH